MPTPPTTPPSTPEMLGIPAAAAEVQLQPGFYQELVSKLAWAIGTAYRVPYSKSRCLARETALGVARSLVMDHGYGVATER